MTLLDGDVEWNSSATSHGKGEVDGTCKRRVQVKTNARRADPQTSQKFAEGCTGITLLHCTKEEIETAKSHLDHAWTIRMTG